MVLTMVKLQPLPITLALLCYVILLASAKACEGVFFVDPEGRGAGSFYIVKSQDGSWSRRGYLPAGSLVRSKGFSGIVLVQEKLYHKSKHYTPFVSEFGQAGFIRWSDIKHGAISKIDGAPIQGMDKRLDCNEIERFVAPDSWNKGFRILAKPEDGSKVLDNPSASSMAAVFVVKGDYQERKPGGQRFLKVHYRVGTQGPVVIGYVDRREQTNEIDPGRFRLTQRVEDIQTVKGVSRDKECKGTCWGSVLQDFYQSVKNFDLVGKTLAQKPCTREANVEFMLSVDSGATVSLVEWLNVGASAVVEASLKFTIPDDEVLTTERWFLGERTEIGVQRTHKCADTEKGPAKFIGLRFANYENPVRLLVGDLESACFSQLPAFLRHYHSNGMFIVGRSDRVIFPRYVSLRHLIQNRIGNLIDSGFLSDKQLQELDRLTWLSIEQVLEHQHPKAYGIPPNPCRS